MVDRLRAKSGGAEIPVAFGDFADLSVGGTFRLIYVVFNTFFALLSQEDQTALLPQRRLASGNRVEVCDRGLCAGSTLYNRNQRVSTTRVETDRVQLECVAVRPGGTEVDQPAHPDWQRRHCAAARTATLRLASELDLMARWLACNWKRASAGGRARSSPPRADPRLGLREGKTPKAQLCPGRASPAPRRRSGLVYREPSGSAVVGLQVFGEARGGFQ